MEPRRSRGLLIAGGVCGILWPILSLGYFAAYPLAASGAMHPESTGLAAFSRRMADLGQRPVVVTLEWAYTALPLLLWLFLLALNRLLSRRGQRDLMLVAVSLGFLGIGLMMVSGAFNATALHGLGQAYADAGSDAAGTAILGALDGLVRWMRGLNQLSSLLYQGCVGLIGLALIRSRTWRGWGWAGLIGAILALPAKLSLGLVVPTNAIWTGLAYGLWPMALGIGLIRHKGEGTPDPERGRERVTGNDPESPG
jgi:hypothetical protein